MRLRDIFGRPADQPPEHIAELYRRVGKLDATTSSLELQWQSYRDELRRLVQRLEKRDQRAELKTSHDDAPQPTNGDGVVSQYPPLDAISVAVHQRRQRRR